MLGIDWRRLTPLERELTLVRKYFDSHFRRVGTVYYFSDYAVTGFQSREYFKHSCIELLRADN